MFRYKEKLPAYLFVPIRELHAIQKCLGAPRKMSELGDLKNHQLVYIPKRAFLVKDISNSIAYAEQNPLFN